ncbi:MAG TPA: SRPBCC domain-containing protein [Patescibacteria group bacterium]|nr:SRPBCC domain-containing protein [Patescibacteria group bacterium]
MKKALLMNFTVDKENKTLHVEREFAAPLAKVWAAWTQSELLDQWFAPKPYQVRTVSMNFREGGHWVYAMMAPDGTEHCGRMDYKTITPLEKFTALDAFCDAEGNINEALPRADWSNTFKENGNTTMISVVTKYDKLEDLETVIKMGVQEGLTMCLQNLDELLEKEEVAVG